jgi:hypothetical protein
MFLNPTTTTTTTNNMSTLRATGGSALLKTDSENVVPNGVRGGGLKERALKAMASTVAQQTRTGSTVPGPTYNNNNNNVRRNALGVLDMNTTSQTGMSTTLKLQPPVVLTNEVQEMVNQGRVKGFKGVGSNHGVVQEGIPAVTTSCEYASSTVSLSMTTLTTTDDPEEIALISKMQAILMETTTTDAPKPNLLEEIPDIDKGDALDAQAMAEYVEDIYQYLFDIEKPLMPSMDYMDRQPYLSWKHRGILVDWMVQVHYRFKMVPETLFMAVNFLDRYLGLQEVGRDKLQLVGIAALLVASKYEEIYPPPVADFVFFSDNFYTGDQILQMERILLKILQFQLGYPTPLHFLRRVSKADDLDIQTRTLGKYLMEVSLLDQRFLRYLPSMIGAASMYLARVMLKRGPWLPILEHYGRYSEQQLLPLVYDLLLVLGREMKLDSVYKKYASSKFLRASLFAEQFVQKTLNRT